MKGTAHQNAFISKVTVVELSMRKNVAQEGN
jgi:hypothetical protein